jgi:hypothetical protein
VDLFCCIYILSCLLSCLPSLTSISSTTDLVLQPSDRRWYLHKLSHSPSHVAQPTPATNDTIRMRATNVLCGATSLLSFFTLSQSYAIPQYINQTAAIPPQFNDTASIPLRINETAAIPQRINETMTSTAVSGYKNVAYFVNWVRPRTTPHRSTTNSATGYLRTQLQSPRSSRRGAYSCALRLCQRATGVWRGLSYRHLVRHRQALPYRLLE